MRRAGLSVRMVPHLRVFFRIGFTRRQFSRNVSWDGRFWRHPPRKGLVTLKHLRAIERVRDERVRGIIG